MAVRQQVLVVGGGFGKVTTGIVLDGVTAPPLRSVIKNKAVPSGGPTTKPPPPPCTRNPTASNNCCGSLCDPDIPTIDRADSVAMAQSIVPGLAIQSMCLAHSRSRGLSIRSRQQHRRGAAPNLVTWR
jgi:hypothetical protein